MDDVVFALVDVIDEKIESKALTAEQAQSILTSILFEIDAYWADYDLLIKKYGNLDYLKRAVSDVVGDRID